MQRDKISWRMAKSYLTQDKKEESQICFTDENKVSVTADPSKLEAVVMPHLHTSRPTSHMLHLKCHLHSLSLIIKMCKS